MNFDGPDAEAAVADPAGWLDSFSLDTPPPGFAANPYPFYAALRRHAPVHTLAPGHLLLTRYDDVQAVLGSTQAGIDRHAERVPRLRPGTPIHEHHARSLAFTDPPLHTHLRHIVMGALGPHAVLRMQHGLVSRVDELLHGMAAHAAPDLIEHFAARIPIDAIGDLLTVPASWREQLHAWSRAIRPALEPGATAEQLAAANAAVQAFAAGLRELLDERRLHPLDPRTDALTRMLQGDEQGPLDEQALVHNCIFLLDAGHETTTHLIGNAVHLLLQHRAAWRQLFDQPVLIPGAIDEILRLESPLQWVDRRLSAPLPLGGREQPAGTLLTLALGAANRDPEVFAHPDQLDLTRRPNEHLAFGHGVHACSGMNLVRTQARVAIGALLAHYPGLRLAGEPERDTRLRHRGLRRLPVHLV